MQTTNEKPVNVQEVEIGDTLYSVAADSNGLNYLIATDLNTDERTVVTTAPIILLMDTQATLHIKGAVKIESAVFQRIDHTASEQTTRFVLSNYKLTARQIMWCGHHLDSLREKMVRPYSR